MKLSFNFNDSTQESEASYRGLLIKAVQDPHAGNPWDDWDGSTPLVVSYGRDSLRSYSREAGFDLLKPFSSHGIPDALLRRHMPAICAAFEPFDIYSSWGSKVATFSDWLASEAKDRTLRGDSMTEHKRDLLQEALDGMRDRDRLSALQSIYQAIGWQALCTSSTGYSQGDYAELLLVATPAFVKSTGAPALKNAAYWREDMKAAAELYGAWAWGNVYGYVIDQDGETLDSCWGYYGTDFEANGLADSAMNAADCLLKVAQYKREQCLARLIKNRVPLDKRPALLAVAQAVQS